MDACAANPALIQPRPPRLLGRDAVILRRSEQDRRRISADDPTETEAALTGAAAAHRDAAPARDLTLTQEFEARLADCPRLAYRVALGVLRNAAEAEDVAQEAMLRAFRNFHRLRDRDRFRAWLVRTAWRLSLDHIRSSGRRERRETTAFELRPEPRESRSAEDLAAATEIDGHVACALDRLPEKLRLVIILAAIEGHDTRGVAALLGIPEGTVKSRLFAARKRLAEALEWLR